MLCCPQSSPWKVSPGQRFCTFSDHSGALLVRHPWAKSRRAVRNAECHTHTLLSCFSLWESDSHHRCSLWDTACISTYFLLSDRSTPGDPGGARGTGWGCYCSVESSGGLADPAVCTLSAVLPSVPAVQCPWHSPLSSVVLDASCISPVLTHSLGCRNPSHPAGSPLGIPVSWTSHPEPSLCVSRVLSKAELVR